VNAAADLRIWRVIHTGESTILLERSDGRPEFLARLCVIFVFLAPLCLIPERRSQMRFGKQRAYSGQIMLHVARLWLK
jgi:hypothetical protein